MDNNELVGCMKAERRQPAPGLTPSNKILRRPNDTAFSIREIKAVIAIIPGAA